MKKPNRSEVLNWLTTPPRGRLALCLLIGGGTLGMVAFVVALDYLTSYFETILDQNPLIALLCLSLPAWVCVVGRSNLLLNALGRVLGSFNVAIATLGIIQLAFNWFNPDVKWLLAIENWIGRSWMLAHDWFELDFIAFVGLTVVLILVTAYVPRLRLVSRFFAVKKQIACGVSTLGFLSCFTFFSQAQVEFLVDEGSTQAQAHLKTDDTENSRLNEQTAALRDEITRSLVTAAPHWDARQKTYFQERFWHIASEFRYSQHEIVSRLMAVRDTESATHSTDWSESHSHATSPFDPDARRITFAKETWTGAEKIFVKGAGSLTPDLQVISQEFLANILGALSPGLDEIAKAYFKEVVHQGAKALFEKGFRAPYGARIEANVAKWTSKASDVRTPILIDQEVLALRATYAEHVKTTRIQVERAMTEGHVKGMRGVRSTPRVRVFVP